MVPSQLSMHLVGEQFLSWLLGSLGAIDPAQPISVLLSPRDLQVLQAKRAHQEWPARKAVT